jgi:hypothetical protein
VADEIMVLRNGTFTARLPLRKIAGEEVLPPHEIRAAINTAMMGTNWENYGFEF